MMRTLLLLILSIIVMLATVVSCQQPATGEFKWRWHDISSLSVLSDESILAGSRKGGMLVWNPITGESMLIPTENEGVFSTVSSGLIAFADNKKNLQILTKTDFSVKNSQITSAFVGRIAFSDGYLVVDQSLHGPLMFRVENDGNQLVPVTLLEIDKIDEAHNVAIHATSNVFASGVVFKSGLFNPDYGLSVWKTDGTLLWQKRGEKALFNGLEFSSDGKLIVTADKAGWLKIWRASDGKILQEKKQSRGFTAARFLDDGKSIVTGDFSGRLVVWSVESLEPEIIIQAQQEGYMPVILMKDGRIVTGGSSGLIKIIDLTKPVQ